MIEEQAAVVAVEGPWAWVRTERGSSCGGCAARSGCGSGALARLLPSQRRPIRVANTLRARPGEQVVVAIEETALLRTSLLVYLLPLLALFAGGLSAELLVAAAGGAATDASVMAGGLIGLAVGLLFVRWRGRSRGAPQIFLVRRSLPETALRLYPNPAILKR